MILKLDMEFDPSRILQDYYDLGLEQTQICITSKDLQGGLGATHPCEEPLFYEVNPLLKDTYTEEVIKEVFCSCSFCGRSPSIVFFFFCCLLWHLRFVVAPRRRGPHGMGHNLLNGAGTVHAGYRAGYTYTPPDRRRVGRVPRDAADDGAG